MCQLILTKSERAAIAEAEAVFMEREMESDTVWCEGFWRQWSDPLVPCQEDLADSKSQKGAYKILDNAKKCADQNPGYKVFDTDGKVVYEPKAAAPAGIGKNPDVRRLF